VRQPMPTSPGNLSGQAPEWADEPESWQGWSLSGRQGVGRYVAAAKNRIKMGVVGRAVAPTARDEGLPGAGAGGRSTKDTTASAAAQSAWVRRATRCGAAVTTFPTVGEPLGLSDGRGIGIKSRGAKREKGLRGDEEGLGQKAGRKRPATASGRAWGNQYQRPNHRPGAWTTSDGPSDNTSAALVVALGQTRWKRSWRPQTQSQPPFSADQ